MTHRRTSKREAGSRGLSACCATRGPSIALGHLMSVHLTSGETLQQGAYATVAVGVRRLRRADWLEFTDDFVSSLQQGSSDHSSRRNMSPLGTRDSSHGVHAANHEAVRNAAGA
jgi:hypothetical protein